VVCDGLGIFLDILRCNMGSKIVIILFLMFVLSGVWVFFIVF
jgi:hypothetical protein